MQLKIIPAVVFLSLLLLAVTGCQEKNDTTSLTLATSKNAWCALPIIAKNKGYFAEEGLDVAVQYLQGGRFCMDALISKSADIGTVVETNIAFTGLNGNEQAVVIGNVVKSKSMAIIARKSSGIAIPSDLNGKTITFTPGMTGHIFAHRLFEKYDIDLESVNVEYMLPNAIPPAIISGNPSDNAKRIDAASTWEPFVSRIRDELGEDAIVFREPDIYTGYMHLAARKVWAEENPEAAKSVLKAIQKAEQFLKEHTEEAQLIISEEINVEPDLLKQMWPYFEFGLTMNIEELAKAAHEEGEMGHKNTRPIFGQISS